VNSSAAGPVDARGDRLAQGLVGVVLLGAYVFGLPWLVPFVALVCLAGALLGPHGDPLFLLYIRLVAPRLGPADNEVPAEAIRAQDAVLAAIGAAATLLFLLGATPFGWVLAIAGAIVAIVAATTGVHLGEVALHRFMR
jgi:hypothetical protein